MSRDHVPGSMDLLLDTMCNTFGGVVFIALSLSLAFFISRSQSNPVDDIAKAKQELAEQQEEYRTLLRKRDSLAKKLASVKELTPRPGRGNNDLPETVTKLEQDCKDRQRDTSLLELTRSDLKSKTDKLTEENRKTESEILQKSKAIPETVRKLEEEYKQLVFIVDTLNEKLRSMPVKKMHFAHNRSTARAPYILLVMDNRLYRLGSDYHHSSKEVKVKRSGNKLLLTGIDGKLLVMLTAADIRSLFPDFNTATSFLWILVHPDSYKNFVGFRRLLRIPSLPVYWYVSSEPILYLVDKADYSASY